MCVCVCVCVCMSVCVCARKRERERLCAYIYMYARVRVQTFGLKCMYTCVCVWKGGRERETDRQRERERERMSVCVCVCVGERERRCVCVWERERQILFHCITLHYNTWTLFNFLFLLFYRHNFAVRISIRISVPTVYTENRFKKRKISNQFITSIDKNGYLGHFKSGCFFQFFSHCSRMCCIHGRIPSWATNLLSFLYERCFSYKVWNIFVLCVTYWRGLFVMICYNMIFYVLSWYDMLCYVM